MINDAFKLRLQQKLELYLKKPIQIVISLQEKTESIPHIHESPAENKNKQQSESLNKLKKLAETDTFLQTICKTFDGTIDYLIH